MCWTVFLRLNEKPKTTTAVPKLQTADNTEKRSPEVGIVVNYLDLRQTLVDLWTVDVLSKYSWRDFLT